MPLSYPICKSKKSINWHSVAKAAKEVSELTSTGWGSALSPAGTAGTGSVPGKCSQTCFQATDNVNQHSWETHLSLQPSELTSNLKYCIRWEARLWEKDLKWIQNYFRTLKEGYVNLKSGKKIRLEVTVCISLEQHCPQAADLSLQVNKWSLSNTSDLSVRGQPKAGLRIAKWKRVIKWKFRGISNRASHLLGLTDL